MFSFVISHERSEYSYKSVGDFLMLFSRKKS